MTDHLHLRPHDVKRQNRPDGSILLTSSYPLGPIARSTGEWLDHWAGQTPDAIFLAEREGQGWREVTYGLAQAQVRAIASHLVTLDLGPDRPVMILSGNGIHHGLLSLAAQYIGIPVVPVAEQYSLIPAAHPRLTYVANLTRPGLVYAADSAAYAQALALPCFQDALAYTDDTFATLLAPGDGDISAAAQSVGPDTLAKILLTSGSTSDPKGVLTTQGMMTTNQAQIAAALPFVTRRPPRIVDWLPWNHVFGGSYNFNLMLANGGALYVDDGKPAPGLFDRTLENLALQSATISFNVPVGFALLVAALDRDAALLETYFSDLDMIFYAGASLPQETWEALERLALKAGQKLPLITTSWGLTETAPGATINHQPAKGAGIVGVPYPGTEVKLVPDETGRCDVRLRGGNITRGYLNAPEKTAEAFDEEGYFITGDAMRLVDPDDPNQGLRFDGRLSEDFKLGTGTWVQAANLRLALLAALSPFAQDAVIVGEGRDEIGVLILPNRGGDRRSGLGGLRGKWTAAMRGIAVCLARAAVGLFSACHRQREQGGLCPCPL